VKDFVGAPGSKLNALDGAVGLNYMLLKACQTVTDLQSDSELMNALEKSVETILA
jgi:hypothetical protein